MIERDIKILLALKYLYILYRYQDTLWYSYKTIKILRYLFSTFVFKNEKKIEKTDKIEEDWIIV